MSDKIALLVENKQLKEKITKLELEVQRIQKSLNDYPYNPNAQQQIDWYWKYAAPNVVSEG